MTADTQRLACIDLLRLAEPGDEILKAGVLALGLSACAGSAGGGGGGGEAGGGEGYELGAS